MLMGMRRDSVAGRSQFHMDGSLGDDFLASLQAGQDLHTATVRSPQLHFLLPVAIGVQLQVNEVQPLVPSR